MLITSPFELGERSVGRSGGFRRFQAVSGGFRRFRGHVAKVRTERNATQGPYAEDRVSTTADAYGFGRAGWPRGCLTV